MVASQKISSLAVALSVLSILIVLGFIMAYFLIPNSTPSLIGPTGSSGSTGPTGPQGFGDTGPTGPRGPISTINDIIKSVIVTSNYNLFVSDGTYLSPSYKIEPFHSYIIIRDPTNTQTIPFTNNGLAAYTGALYFDLNTSWILGSLFNIIANVPFYINSPNTSTNTGKLFLPKQNLYTNYSITTNIPPLISATNYVGTLYFPAGYLYTFTIIDSSTTTVLQPDGTTVTLPVMYYTYSRTNLANTFATFWNYQIATNTNKTPSYATIGNVIPVNALSTAYIYSPNPLYNKLSYQPPTVAYNNLTFTIDNNPTISLITPQIVITHQALLPGDVFYYEPFNHNKNTSTGTTYSAIILMTANNIGITIINSLTPNGSISLFNNGDSNNNLNNYTFNLDMTYSYKFKFIGWISNTINTDTTTGGTYLLSITKSLYTA